MFRKVYYASAHNIVAFFDGCVSLSLHILLHINNRLAVSFLGTDKPEGAVIAIGYVLIAPGLIVTSEDLRTAAPSVAVVGYRACSFETDGQQVGLNLKGHLIRTVEEIYRLATDVWNAVETGALALLGKREALWICLTHGQAFEGIGGSAGCQSEDSNGGQGLHFGSVDFG